MSTPHNEANIGDIAKTVVMPGDPLRAKYIAENFLDNYKLVNQVRGMYAYTGTYKGKEITVMAHGMGMPSVGIYTYELFKIYGVENIIRIGSCGGYKPELKLFDIILTKNVFSESNYALTLNNDNCHIVSSNRDLNSIIEDTAKDSNINVVLGNTVCTDCFDVYMTDVNKFLERVPDNFNPVAAEMEAFALFYNAKLLNKKASCLMSVVDSKFIKDIATPEERQTGLNTMIKLALDSAIKI
ncbi:purine nucleoside phosphorylase [Clostridium sp. CAG:470]|nr:MAG: purine-nucleoside phosphorylase [Clostridium sp. 28_17]CDE14234.1 purine nucleoside phosphorylase [Clostridium sp. CAG:470]